MRERTTGHHTGCERAVTRPHHPRAECPDPPSPGATSGASPRLSLRTLPQDPQDPAGWSVCQLATAGLVAPAGPWPKTLSTLPVICWTTSGPQVETAAGHAPMAAIQLTVPVSSTPAPLRGSV